MSISRILSECPTIQMSLSELFIEVGQRESLPFVEFLLSPENSSMIKMQVSPGGGKLRTVEARWIQRLPETEVEEGASIMNCTATNVYGDSTTTYTLETTDTYQASQLISKEDIARHCQDNSRYVFESINRLLDVIDRKVASAAGTQAAAQLGAWGADVEAAYTVASDFLQLPTVDSNGAIADFTLGDLQMAVSMANYPGAPVSFGGQAMWRYLKQLQSGCCNQNGLDLASVAQLNGLGFAYDKRLAAALGGNNYNLVTTLGAMQWISFELASWSPELAAITGSNYVTTTVFTPTGVPVALTLKDDCGSLSIVGTHTGKLVSLPTDIYEAGDDLAGVNYVNGVQVVNP